MAAGQALRQTVELAVAAEELGFSSFWVAQHHAGALDGHLPSPLVLLAAIAERTSTIRLGTAVIAPGLEDPLRLAEDAAVVDALAGGRLEVGLGAGADPAATALFGRSHDRRHADCAEAVDRVLALLEGGTLVPAAPALRHRLWWATGSAEGCDGAAHRGMGLLAGRAEPHTAAVLERYWTRAAAEPRVAVVRVLPAGAEVAGLCEAWGDDPARAWATELIVQSTPRTAGFAEHLRALRLLAPAGRVGAVSRR